MNFAIPSTGAGMWLLDIALLIYWVVVILAVIAEDREPTITLAWILLLTLVPIIGLVAYWFVGRDWKHRVPRQAKTIAATEIARECMALRYEPYRTLQHRLLERTDGTLTEKIARSIKSENDSRPLPVRTLDVYDSGAEFFSALKRDMERATRFIHLQYFIWECDELTAQVTQILLDRLAAGVEVRITYDWFGSLTYRKRELHELERAGAVVHADARQIWSLNYRNHRKIAVIDAEIGYTGGHNMGQEYIDGGKRYPAWRDTSCRITGPGVGLLQKWFAYRWLTQFGEDKLFADRYFPVEDAQLAAGDPLMVGLVAQGVDDPWESSRRTHTIAIAGATTSLRVQSPYFVPDASTYDALLNAALAGVDVKFMMTGLVDHYSAFWAAQSYWRQLIQAGGRVYLYEAGFFHSKTIAIDSEVCALGTMNLDLRSLRLQRELMLWVYDSKRALEAEAIFDHDIEGCREISLRDIEDFSAWQRFRSSAYRLSANLL